MWKISRAAPLRARALKFSEKQGIVGMIFNIKERR
jgi:hypothetical protein